MTRVSWFVSVVLLALAAAGAQAQSARNLDALMQKSGLHKQVGQLEGLMRGGMDAYFAEQAAGGKGAALGASERTEMARAISRSYAPDGLRGDVRATLAREFSADDEAVVMVWLDSDTGKRITALEEAYGEMNDAPGIERREKSTRDLLKVLRPERRALIERLASATNAAEAGARFMGNMTLAIALGGMAATDGDTSGVEKLRRSFEAQRPEIAKVMLRETLSAYAWMYRTVPDAEFTRYVEFAETPAGLRYHDASNLAVDHAMARASLEFGREMAEIGKRRAGAKAS